MQYAEVIMPLPLPQLFTYSIPDDISPRPAVGSRVLVQFGRRKFYTAVVANITVTAPEGYEVKPIVATLDEFPIVRFPQLKFWDWIADYYLCSIGDVMKAALPSGLKVESETVVNINSEFDPTEVSLSEEQASLLIKLEAAKRIKVSELQRDRELKSLNKVLNSLLAMGAIEIAERTVEKYRPHRLLMISLNIERDDPEKEAKLHHFFNLAKRSAKQERVLLAFLDLTGWLRPDGEVEIEKKLLVEAAEASSSVMKSMIEKGIFRVYKKIFNRFNRKAKITAIPSQLSESQQTALTQINDSFRNRDVVLLHGVTGSGKTEIYCQLIKRALDSGNQVLYLVPEISLTTQLTDRLRLVFGDQLLVYHSKFSDNERVDVWKKLLTSTEPMLVLGARSAVFLPFAHIGLVIVDEEHEQSYKQIDPAPRYNARDAAMVLASMHGAKVLLGSATPSVETYYKALNGKFGLVELKERFGGSELPEVEIVDMRRQRKEKLNRGILSSPLLMATTQELADGNQAILFQNRRGFAPVVVCRECGWTPKCINCDVSLVFHKQLRQLRCHYCGHSASLPNVCPACGQNSVEVYGYGTERISEEVEQAFPEAKVVRMDLDSTRNKDDFQHILEDFSSGRTDILVGTQMVTKGLDFERVKVVGVLNADTLLNFPDFRSSERAFNMLVQVAGRAGRRGAAGKVFIQTTAPDSRVLAYVKHHDFKGFYEMEIADREKYSYPPFTRVVNIYIKHKDAAAVDAIAVAYAKRLISVFGNRVLGPEKPFVSRVSTWYLQSIMLKVESGASMRKVKGILRDIYVGMAENPMMKQAIVYYDVDPF